MKDSGIEWIGEIPEDWKVIRIKNAALLKARIGWQGLRSDEFLLDPDLPFLVTGTDFYNGIVDWESCVRISEKRYEMDKNIQIKENDLLITKDGTIGKLAIAIDCPSKATLNSGVFVMRNSGRYKYIVKYMFYLLQSDQFYLWFELNESGNSTIRHLYQKDFLNFSFTYPSVKEQEKISTFLDKKTMQIDDIKSTIIKEIESLENYKKSVITKAVTKGLDKNVEMKDSRIEWIGEIPEHWIKTKVKHACSLIGSGATPSSYNSDYYSDDGIYWIQSGDLYKTNEIITTKKKISEKAIKTHSTLKIYESPYLVMAMYGASVGNLSISKIDAATNQACCVMKENSSTNLFYLYYWLLFVKDDLLRKSEGGSQPNISQDKIKNQIMYFPTILEQNEIATYLDEKCKLIDDSISLKKKQIETLEEYKKSLIYEYVTGKKEVTDGEGI